MKLHKYAEIRCFAVGYSRTLLPQAACQQVTPQRKSWGDEHKDKEFRFCGIRKPKAKLSSTNRLKDNLLHCSILSSPTSGAGMGQQLEGVRLLPGFK
jgi:hypothetical protein